MAHHADALVIHCIDLRFQESIQKFLESKGAIGKFDRIAWPGTSKDLETVLKAAEVSFRLHEPGKVVLIEHEDCGAYGEDNSESVHKEKAESLAGKLKELHPDVEVEIRMAMLDGSVKPL